MFRKRIFLSPPHMGGDEMGFIREAFESNYIAPLGPMVDAFEKEFAEYIGIKYCLALSSGTAAMHLALRNLDIKDGDEVFTSTLTFIGSISPIIFEGAKPVFIDCERESWNMDPRLLKSELESCAKKGKLPKAVITTDLFGQCSNYKRIYSVCKEFNIPVIVDAAEALGSRYKMEDLDKIGGSDRQLTDQKHEKNNKWIHAGAGAKVAIYSFNGNKIITTSGGGMFASDDKDQIEHARKLSQQAKEKFAHYEHEEIGYNYRMSNILAALGRGQMRVLDKRVEKKRWIFNYYREALKDIPGIEFMPEPSYSRSNRWLTVILINSEEFGADWKAVHIALEKEDIESKPIWKPMHLQPLFQIKENGVRHKKRYRSRTVGGEVSEDLFKRGICLPSGTAMNEEDLDRVINVITNMVKRNNYVHKSRFEMTQMTEVTEKVILPSDSLI